MGNIFNSVLMSFNMYSILPLPYAKWKEENMKYVLIFFPLVGLVEALIYILVWKLGIMLKLESVFLAALLSVVSIIYTGGIHFDGYLDTCDALGSNQSMERKLEILRDSHIGAYALMGGIIYFILYFGAMMQIKSFTELLLFAAFHACHEECKRERLGGYLYKAGGQAKKYFLPCFDNCPYERPAYLY